MAPASFQHGGDTVIGKQKSQLDDLHLRKIDLADTGLGQTRLLPELTQPMDTDVRRHPFLVRVNLATLARQLKVEPELRVHPDVAPTARAAMIHPR